MNPYDPPVETTHTGVNPSPASSGTIYAKFTVTPEYFVEALRRYRSQHKGRRLWLWFRYFAAAIFILVAVIGLFVPQYIASLFMTSLAVFIFYPHKIDDYFAMRNFRKSPRCDEELTVNISEDGFHASSSIENSQLHWNAFTKATVFDDGALIFQGPKMVHWIPYESLEREGEAETLSELLQSKLPTNQELHRRSRAESVGRSRDPG